MKIETKREIKTQFDINQEIYDIYGHCWEIKKIELVCNNYDELWEVYTLRNKETKKHNHCILPHDNDRFFATKEEAEQRLKEIKGESDDDRN